MPRYYKKRYARSGARDKYSVEQSAGFLEVPAGGQAYNTVVAPVSLQGMRKVKHLTVSVASAEDSQHANTALAYWALVYVPQGTAVSTLTTAGGSAIYEPNQFVMNCGVVDFSAGPVRFTSPVSRNLNSGDFIVLIMSNISATTGVTYHYVVRYAITLQ